MHEAQCYEKNCFLTLTYSKEKLPSDYSLHKRHWQLFAKKLRKSLPHKIRFYMCGEYGDQLQRPHYHAIIFNHDFDDKVLFKVERGNKLFTSSTLTNLWEHGHASIGDVTFESAAYVARYCTKKFSHSLDPDKVIEHYTRRHPDTGAINVVEPEFALMSRRPGIGATWLNKYKTDVYPSDQVVSRGRVMSPPRFYDQSLTEEELERLKRRRKKDGLRQKPHQTSERLRARAAVRDQKITVLKRNLKDH